MGFFLSYVNIFLIMEKLSYPFILFVFSPELIFKQLGETECLLSIYEKSKADPKAV